MGPRENNMLFSLGKDEKYNFLFGIEKEKIEDGLSTTIFEHY